VFVRFIVVLMNWEEPRPLVVDCVGGANEFVEIIWLVPRPWMVDARLVLLTYFMEPRPLVVDV